MEVYTIRVPSSVLKETDSVESETHPSNEEIVEESHDPRQRFADPSKVVHFLVPPPENASFGAF